MGMVLMADLVILSETAFFLDGHLAAGMCPSSSSWWLPRLVGYRRAMDLFLTNRRVAAQEALDMGLVNRVVPDDRLEEAVSAAGEQLTGLDRAALLRTKRAVRHAMENDFRSSTETISYLRAI